MPDVGGSGDRLRLLVFLWRLSRSGGIPGVVRSLVAGLDRDHFDIHVCTARPLLPEDELNELGDGVRFCSLGLDGPASVPARARAAVRLSSVIRELSPDVVHGHSGVGWYLLPWLLRTRRRVPTVLEVHDAPQSKRVSGLNSGIESLMLRSLGVVPLVHSRSVASDLSTAARIDPGRIATIPIGIDTGQFGARSDRAELRESFGIVGDDSVVTYVARLVASKNPSLFVRVATQVCAARPGVRFVLVGDGPEAGALQEQAAGAGLSDRLLMLRRVDDISGVLAASDLFLSTSDYEGFGIAVLEAMAVGLPVVSTAAGGVDDLVVPGETGTITPVGQAAPLADAVVHLVDDPGARREMGRKAAARARANFDVARMVASYERFYWSLAGRAARS